MIQPPNPAAGFTASLDIVLYTYYVLPVIRTFKDKRTQSLFNRQPVRAFRAFERVARRKLEQLHAATGIDDLRHPPGNRLEALKGDRKGQWSLRINRQYRVCFEWRNGHAENVEIVDYH